MDEAQTDAVLKVFVYGTLKPGGRYYKSFCEGLVTSAIAAQVPGSVFDFPQLGYPGMVGGSAEGDEWVQGYLLFFRYGAEQCVEILSRLDELEGYVSGRSPQENEYERRWTAVYVADEWGDGEADETPQRKLMLDYGWVYTMQPERVRQYGGLRVDGGDWVA